MTDIIVLIPLLAFTVWIVGGYFAYCRMRRENELYWETQGQLAKDAAEIEERLEASSRAMRESVERFEIDSWRECDHVRI